MWNSTEHYRSMQGVGLCRLPICVIGNFSIKHIKKIKIAWKESLIDATI